MRLSRMMSAVCVAVFLAVPSAFAEELTDDITMDDNMAEATSAVSQIVRQQEQFSMLAKALGAAGLMTELDDSAPVTLFAPTNDAFGQLPEGAFEGLLKPENKDELKKVLLYHVLQVRVPDRDIKGRKFEVVSMEGEHLTLDGTGETMMVNDAPIVQDQIDASNGLIHVIDGVLMP